MTDLDYQIAYQRAVEAVIWSIPAISIRQFREGAFRDFGITWNDVALWSKPVVARREDANRIVIASDGLAQIQVAWMAQWRRAPTPEKLRSLMDDKVHEEILAREAMSLGLDKDDTIVKRRMAQKMEFLMEDVSALKEPSPGDLRRWFDENAQRFALPGLLTFHHLYFSSDQRGAQWRDSVCAADPLRRPQRCVDQHRAI